MELTVDIRVDAFVAADIRIVDGAGQDELSGIRQPGRRKMISNDELAEHPDAGAYKNVAPDCLLFLARLPAQATAIKQAETREKTPVKNQAYWDRAPG